MRELERDLPDTPSGCADALDVTSPAATRSAEQLQRLGVRRLAIVGAGRLGRALAEAFAGPGLEVAGPLRRGSRAEGADAVLLCVPDAEIAAAAAALRPGAAVGHCSGARGLAVLAPHEAFSLHPLMTVTARGARFAGAGAAVAGSTPRAITLARALAELLGMRPFELDDAARPLYHAAAAMAANFLVALEGAAEQLAGGAGVPRELLVPLARAALENWAELGARAALTGPVVRGDEATVRVQREAIAAAAPELTGLFDELVGVTRAIAGVGEAPRAGGALTAAGTAA